MGNRNSRKCQDEKETTQNTLARVSQELETVKRRCRSKENEVSQLQSEITQTQVYLSNVVRANKKQQGDLELMENTIEKYRIEKEATKNKLESALQELKKNKSLLKLKEYEVSQLKSTAIQTSEANLVKTNERRRDFELMENTLKAYKVEKDATQNKLGSVLQELEKTKSLLKSKEYEVNQLESKMIQTTNAPAPPDNVFQTANSSFIKTQSRSFLNQQYDRKAEKNIEELERELKEKREEYKQLKGENEKLENELRKKTKQSDKLASELEKTITDFNRTSGKGIDQILSDENLRLKDELKRLQIENNEQKIEINQWKLRLSKVAGERLVTGNTAITDLGDKYRPQKLSEMFVSLYDDKWTDAFEVIKGEDDNDQQACKKLLKIFQNCWEFSLLYSKNQLEALQLSFINADIKDENTKRDVLDNYPSHLTKLIKDTRRCFAQEFLPSLQQVYWKKDKTNMSESLWPYVKACIEMCWHSAISDPALQFMFSADNLEDFKPYTKSGSDVDYVVWPAMHLHEFGPLLLKGVVQFKKLKADLQ